MSTGPSVTISGDDRDAILPLVSAKVVETAARLSNPDINHEIRSSAHSLLCALNSFALSLEGQQPFCTFHGWESPRPSQMAWALHALEEDAESELDQLEDGLLRCRVLAEADTAAAPTNRPFTIPNEEESELRAKLADTHARLALIGGIRFKLHSLRESEIAHIEALAPATAAAV